MDSSSFVNGKPDDDGCNENAYNLCDDEVDLSRGQRPAVLGNGLEDHDCLNLRSYSGSTILSQCLLTTARARYSEYKVFAEVLLHLGMDRIELG
ncbi:MAG: hypothetical protein CL912_21700 [Deltaproteobacteria bacterium]|nr:hypothetical protein [Deltaproteobacteria bacterium]